MVFLPGFAAFFYLWKHFSAGIFTPSSPFTPLVGFPPTVLLFYVPTVASFGATCRLVLLSRPTLVQCYFKSYVESFNKLICWYFVNRFQPYVFESGKVPPNPSYEETTLYHLMTIGTVVTTFVFSPNPPYSRNIKSNRNYLMIETIPEILHVTKAHPTQVCLWFGLSLQRLLSYVSYSSQTKISFHG